MATDTVNPLALVEEYAREEIVQRADEFLDVAGRAIVQWGTSQEQAIAVFVRTHAAEVTDAESFQRVGELLRDAAQLQDAATRHFEPRKSLGYKLHRLICARETTVLAPITSWLTRAKSSWDAYRREEERRRREEEQRLAEEARRAEQERLAREAELLAQRGEHELANQVLEQAVHTPAPVISMASSLPPVKGVSSTSNWKWRPLGGDTPEARARAVKLVPREFLCLDERKLNAYAKAHGSSARIPGIEFFDAGSVRVRA